MENVFAIFGRNPCTIVQRFWPKRAGNVLLNSKYFSAGKNSLGLRKWGCEVGIEIAIILRPGEFFKDFTPLNFFTYLI